MSIMEHSSIDKLQEFHIQDYEPPSLYNLLGLLVNSKKKRKKKRRKHPPVLAKTPPALTLNQL